MQIKSFSQLFDELRKPIPGQHKPSIPAPARTPEPQKSKVISTPTREPINKQSALLLRPMRCWLSQPLPPEKLPSPHEQAIEAARAELKIERNSHAETRDALGAARNKIREQGLRIAKQDELIKALQAKLQARDETIRQLEDLKL